MSNRSGKMSIAPATVPTTLPTTLPGARRGSWGTGPDEHRNGSRPAYYFVVPTADGVGQYLQFLPSVRMAPPFPGRFTEPPLRGPGACGWHV